MIRPTCPGNAGSRTHILRSSTRRRPEDPARRAGCAESACIKIAATTVANDAQIDQFVSGRAGCSGDGLLLTGDDKFERLRSECLDVVGETLDARA